MKTLKTLRQIAWIMPLLGALGLATGCAVVAVGAAAGAGAAGYAYVSGVLISTESASLDRTWNATLAAMKELEFPITSQRKDALQASLVARNAYDKKISIRLKKVAEQSTEVRIRVGTFGDETMSRAILEKIKKRL
jgi:L-fucose isomerase-like protein